MSSQGTGSTKSLGFEFQLLESWGNWARGDINLWFSGPGLWHKSGVGSLFSESDMCTADGVIASLAPAHKATIKHWFINGKGHKIDEQKKQTAIAAFSESLAGAISEPY